MCWRRSPTNDEPGTVGTDAHAAEAHIVGLGGGALPVLGDGCGVGVVLHQDGALEGAAETLAQIQARPLGQGRTEPYGAVRLHDSGAAHADGTQRPPGDAGPAQQLGDRAPQPLQTLVGRRRLRHVLGEGAELPAVEIGEKRGDPVSADVKTQKMARLSPEPEAPGGPPLPAGRAFLGRVLHHEPGLDQALDDSFDSRP
jgi:hypothetical protein